MRRAFKRVAAPSQTAHRLKVHNFPAPIRGLVLNENLATAGAAAARQLDNWFPTTTGIRIIGGSSKWATISSGPVISMFTYASGATEELFAADETNIFDITTVADPEVIPSAEVSGRTAGYYSTTQIGTAGGNYLYAVNGADKPLLYDGATFTAIDGVSTPAITGVTTTLLSHVWTFANRLFFVEGGSMRAWYLSVDSIGGAASSFSLAGIFQEGGELLFGATWSLDSGDGLDDKCVFVSSKGEIAVYEGTNPGDAAAWSRVGVYRITAPLGMKAIMKAGGDLLVSVEDGIVPLSEAIRKDPAALSLAAVTRAIEPAWETEVASRRGQPWEIAKWSANNMMIVSQPRTSESQTAQCYIANLETGAWCRRTGWDTRCLAVFNNRAYFGTNAGIVYEMESGGDDDGEPYTAVYVGQFDHLKSPGLTKTIQQARATFIAGSSFNPQVSVSVDYTVDLPSAPNAVDDYTVDEWDSAIWDTAVWDAAQAYNVTSQWVSIGNTGFAIAPQIQVTCGISPLPRVELVAVDLTYSLGGLVV